LANNLPFSQTLQLARDYFFLEIFLKVVYFLSHTTEKTEREKKKEEEEEGGGG
jgi:hypothetical protein